MKSKYYSATELKSKILNEKKLPRTVNQKGYRYTFIAKVRGSIFGKDANACVTLR